MSYRLYQPKPPSRIFCRNGEHFYNILLSVIKSEVCADVLCCLFCSKADTEQILKRIQSHKGVKRVFIINSQGQMLRSSLNDLETERKYASLISELTRKTTDMVRELDPENGLTFLRIRTLTEEIMIAPEKSEGKYTLVVVQDPSDGDSSIDPATDA